MKPFYIASLVLMSVVLPAACDNGGGAAAPSACRTFRTALSVKDRMSQAASAFNPGEPITFELQIANATTAPATLTAGSSCTAVVFEVSDAAKQRHWGSADGIACVLMLQPRTYAPLEVVSEASTWNQKDSGPTGTQVPPGDYVVTASVGQYVSASDGRLLDCRAELGQTATFRIQ
jgi:hypothetical protein